MPRSISLRPADSSDCNALFNWRNDPDTRAASIETSEIDASKHRYWYSQTLQNPLRKILIGMFDQQAIGMVRLDHILAEDRVEVSIILAPEARGAGFAAPLLSKGLEQNPFGTSRFSATIKPTNVASQKIFAACGFRLWRENCLILGERIIEETL